MTSDKNLTWEKKFSDNFKPNIFEKLIKLFETSRKDVIVNLLPSKGGILLDIACGNGDTIFSVSSRFTSVVGLDIAKNRINFATKKSRFLKLTNTKFIKYDLDKVFPLKSESVDFVICEASLSYFYDLNVILSEVRRVLKKSGKFIIEVPNYAFITRRLALLIGIMPKTSSFPGWQDGGALHYFTHKTLKQIANENGFDVEKVANSGVFPSLRKIYPELLAGDIVFVCKKLK